jgi:hypothetical protein
MTGVHIKGRTREGGGISPRWTTATRPSSAGYTAELEPGHSGRAKPAKATELQAPCVENSNFNQPSPIDHIKHKKSTTFSFLCPL